MNFALWCLLTAATAEENGALLSEIVTASLAKDIRLDVIGSADVRRQLELEAEKQTIGCDAEMSCMSELANAMGARYVVYGRLGGLDNLMVLTLNLFDSEQAQAVGRVVLRGNSLSELSTAIDSQLAPLVARLPTTLNEKNRARVLVMGIETEKTQQSTEKPPLFAAGIAAFVTSSACAIVTGTLAVLAYQNDAHADAPETSFSVAKNSYDTRDTQVNVATGFAAGTVVSAIVGGVFLMLDAGAQ